MRLVYGGRFTGDVSQLPHPAHRPGAVRFREPATLREMAVLGAKVMRPLLAAGVLLWLLRVGWVWPSPWGVVWSLLSLLPHELLHALCFRGEVFFYHALSMGVLFVTGPEEMSRGRFVLMSLLPTLVLGVLPLALFLLDPTRRALGTMAILNLPSGAGDLINIWNALTQVPRGGRVYQHGWHTYWFLP